MKRQVKNTVVLSLFFLLAMSCRRGDYICDCKGSNKSFQNIFFNATEREARDLCNAAEEKFEAGNPGLECEYYKKED